MKKLTLPVTALLITAGLALSTPVLAKPDHDSHGDSHNAHGQRDNRSHNDTRHGFDRHDHHGGYKHYGDRHHDYGYTHNDHHGHHDHHDTVIVRSSPDRFIEHVLFAGAFLHLLDHIDDN